MKTFTEKEEKLNQALKKLKNLNLTNPKTKEFTQELFDQKNQLEIEKNEIEEKYKALQRDFDDLQKKIKERNQSQRTTMVNCNT